MMELYGLGNFIRLKKFDFDIVGGWDIELAESQVW